MTGKAQCEHCGGKLRWHIPAPGDPPHSRGYPYVIHADDCPGLHDDALGVPFVMLNGEPVTGSCQVEKHWAKYKHGRR